MDYETPVWEGVVGGASALPQNQPLSLLRTGPSGLWSPGRPSFHGQNPLPGPPVFFSFLNRWKVSAHLISWFPFPTTPRPEPDGPPVGSSPESRVGQVRSVS